VDKTVWHAAAERNYRVELPTLVDDAAVTTDDGN